jgi:hypothetical protein
LEHPRTLIKVVGCVLYNGESIKLEENQSDQFLASLFWFSETAHPVRMGSVNAAQWLVFWS